MAGPTPPITLTAQYSTDAHVVREQKEPAIPIHGIAGLFGTLHRARDARAILLQQAVGGVQTHHAHACALGHSEIQTKLDFRNYLRTHPHRADYAALKERLARDHRHDNIGYMRGKDAFVKTLLAEAEAWSAARLAVGNGDPQH